MGKTLNRKSPSLLLARTAPLSMVLALFACSERQEKVPSTPGAASVFKDSPAPESPPPQSPPALSNTPTPPRGTPPPAGSARTPEQLFLNQGCKACHGPGRAFASSLANSRGKPAEVVAMWILDPQKVRPGTRMPSFIGRISADEALALANWIKAGNPAQ
ncbi:cytochrome c [Archangium sp.]|uniref:c-type cytochrome n=1 Tax=Archangium sp. TaxID=1872627 RepID=UPI002D30FFAD|nr:cytochrome c [Archangium sp.]HYO53937.1 cytochrome c [Archangium sp.]